MLDPRRRDFVTLLIGVAVGWPLAARAQQPAMPVIGFLSPTSADTNAEYLRAFRQALKETGYIEGRNVAIEYRWAENHMDRLPTLAADLVRLRVAVIAAGAQPAAFAAKAATTTIPVVFVLSDDPVRLGLVASLARPVGNMTGVNFLNVEMTAKRLELLRALVPGAVRVAVLVNPANPNAETIVRDAEAAAHVMGLQIRVHKAGTTGEIDATFATFKREPPDALFVGTDPFFRARRAQLALLAAHHRTPATYAFRDYAEAGGLMSYGASLNDAFRQVGEYSGRILNDAWPANSRQVADNSRRGHRMIGRREFITLLGGAPAMTWPLGASAQQAGMPVIGFLRAVSPPPGRCRCAMLARSAEGREREQDSERGRLRVSDCILERLGHDRTRL
jgi:putative tryptophan/tyrosine transport system substrate-binding protein